MIFILSVRDCTVSNIGGRNREQYGLSRKLAFAGSRADVDPNRRFVFRKKPLERSPVLDGLLFREIKPSLDVFRGTS